MRKPDFGDSADQSSGKVVSPGGNVKQRALIVCGWQRIYRCQTSEPAPGVLVDPATHSLTTCRAAFHA